MYESISILALVFGISITTISIDYMFHYYFHGDFSDKKFIVKKRVLFGFITTFGVFVIFSFIDITLFSQLAVFSAVSLSMAYLLFSFVFIHLGIAPPRLKKKAQKTLQFKPLHVVLLSLLMLGYVYQNLEFDSNLKNLDYQNKKLINLSKKFNEGLPNNHYQKIIINETTKERLLQRYEELLKKHPIMLGIGKFVYSDKKCNERVDKLKNYDFKKVKQNIEKYAQQIGFKNAFSNSYKGIEDVTCKMRVIDDMKFKIIKDDDKFYTIGLINSNELVEKSLHVEVVDLGKTLSNDTKIMKSTLVNYMIISIVFIVIILFFLSGVKILFPLMYLLFPLSLVLFVITLIGQINIMHMFALIILLAISIDYGIYLHNTKTTEQTKTAIKYALLSTICGFGVLIFSSTVALYSIGLVISVGVGAIFLLLYASL
jgi:predicted exporter